MGLRMEVAACKGEEVPVVDEAVVEVSLQLQCPIFRDHLQHLDKMLCPLVANQVLDLGHLYLNVV